VSLASIAAAVSLPIAAGVVLATRDTFTWPGAAPFLTVSAALAALVVARHRANIARLLAGQERPMGRAPANGPADGPVKAPGPDDR